MEIENNLAELVKKFESMQLSNTEVDKKLRELVKKVIAQARKLLTQDVYNNILKNDPRQAYRAVKHMIYKSVLGGNLSILRKKGGASGMRYPVPPQVKRFERGGNRIKRTKRTEDLMSYYGSDRGFILRFLNSGTDDRRSKYGNRGHISARNWFPGAGQKQMEAAAANLAKLIEQEIIKFNS